MPKSNGSVESLPPIAALFVVQFDQRIGYKIVWKRSIPDVELEGIVEYKSLPSGLHNVESDLIYFTHNNYAGLSAFLSKPSDEAHRNANFVAVGVLVPLSYGRVGRAWMHAQGLQELAETDIDASTEVLSLEQYWKAHRLDSANDEVRSEALTEPSSPTGVKVSASKDRQPRRSRGLSDATGFHPSDHILSQNHPALSMPAFLDSFGPLSFPLYKAALLRKRILLVGSPPIETSCNFVYDLSIFSNVPPSLTDVLPTPNSLLRIRPLFNVGIHDIPELSKIASEDASPDKNGGFSDEGWIGCTTDDILATKTKVYDLLVQMPASAQDMKTEKAWPHIRTSEGVTIKATQRDLRRYNALRKGLRMMQQFGGHSKRYTDAVEEGEADGDHDEDEPLLSSTTFNSLEDDNVVDGETALVEPSSWASIAYQSFLWWASAGEKDTLLAEENSQDASLLDDLAIATSDSHRASSRSSSKGKRASTSSGLSTSSVVEDPQGVAMVLIAYFHRWTSRTMEILSDIVAAADDENDEGMAEGPIVIDSEDVRRLGLDVWSPLDKQFLKDLVQLYFEREADVKGINVECCGIKLC